MVQNVMGLPAAAWPWVVLESLKLIGSGGGGGGDFLFPTNQTHSRERLVPLLSRDQVENQTRKKTHLSFL